MTLKYLPVRILIYYEFLLRYMGFTLYKLNKCSGVVFVKEYKKRIPGLLPVGIYLNSYFKFGGIIMAINMSYNY